MGALENFERLLAAGQDSALLRYGLGAEYLKLARPGDAAAQLRRATELDPGYSAAWKLLGRALAEAGEHGAAAEAWRRGIETATGRGDVQAAKEMTVFLRRLERTQSSAGDMPPAR